MPHEEIKSYTLPHGETTKLHIIHYGEIPDSYTIPHGLTKSSYNISHEKKTANSHTIPHR